MRNFNLWKWMPSHDFPDLRFNSIIDRYYVGEKVDLDDIFIGGVDVRYVAHSLIASYENEKKSLRRHAIHLQSYPDWSHVPLSTASQSTVLPQLMEVRRMSIRTDSIEKSCEVPQSSNERENKLLVCCVSLWRTGEGDQREVNVSQSKFLTEFGLCPKINPKPIF
jgi:hypothetical protein